jgi:hypothetical protein
VKAKGKFISTLLVMDTFFISFAAGFNSRHVLVVDPSLPPVPPVVQPKSAEKRAEAEPTKTQAKEKTAEHASGSHGSKAGHKPHGHAKTKTSHVTP